jgi:hypothetical protein
MNTGLDGYYKFLSAKGHKTFYDNDLLWFNVRPFIYQAIQRQKLKPNTDRLFREKFALACRWLEPVNSTELITGDLSKEFIVYPPYSFNSLDKKSRNQTRRGLERFVIKQITDYMSEIRQLELIYLDNLKRLKIGRTKQYRFRLWNKWLQVFKNVKEIEIWGAFNNSKLASFLILVPKFDGIEIILHRSHSDFLPVYPNNPLVYSVVEAKFLQGAPWISFGLQKWGLDKGDGLNRFKLGMGFKERLYSNHYLLNPLVSKIIPGQLFNSFIHIFQKIK